MCTHPLTQEWQYKRQVHLKDVNKGRLNFGLFHEKLINIIVNIVRAVKKALKIQRFLSPRKKKRNNFFTENQILSFIINTFGTYPYPTSFKFFFIF